MRAIFTIAKRDFTSLVRSPMFLILAAICCGIWSFLFLQGLFRFAAMMNNPMAAQQGGQSIHNIVFVQHISVVHLIILFLVPIFTMWLLSHEKKQRTYDLLLTSPVSATQIAVGKFFGGWATITTLVLFASVYPLATGFVADFSWAPLISSIVGLIIISGFYVAVGLFASSLTDSIITSFFLAVLFNLAIWFVGSASQSVDGELASNFLSHISIGQQFYSFIVGMVKISAITFFLTAIGFFVFLTQRVVESSRWR